MPGRQPACHGDQQQRHHRHHQQLPEAAPGVLGEGQAGRAHHVIAVAEQHHRLHRDEDGEQQIERGQRDRPLPPRPRSGRAGREHIRVGRAVDEHGHRQRGSGRQPADDDVADQGADAGRRPERGQQPGERRVRAGQQRAEHQQQHGRDGADGQRRQHGTAPTGQPTHSGDRPADRPGPVDIARTGANAMPVQVRQRQRGPTAPVTAIGASSKPASTDTAISQPADRNAATENNATTRPEPIHLAGCGAGRLVSNAPSDTVSAVTASPAPGTRHPAPGKAAHRPKAPTMPAKTIAASALADAAAVRSIGQTRSGQTCTGGSGGFTATRFAAGGFTEPAGGLNALGS
jgi:hypothetical protein